jgi:hypothetical protein
VSGEQWAVKRRQVDEAAWFCKVGLKVMPLPVCAVCGHGREDEPP